MKKLSISGLLFFFSFSGFAQIDFEKGYFIDNEGNKIECFIKNIDWKNNPSEFRFRFSDDEEPGTADISSVSEFGIFQELKYVRATVNIDRSGDDINKLNIDRNPVFNQEQLFLEVLIEGKANLYKYEDGNLTVFFFNTDTSAVEQLIYKKYKTTDNKIGTSTLFQQQLWNSLKCDNITLTKLKDLNYSKNELVKLFIKYNECHNSSFTAFRKMNKKDFINISLRPGLTWSSLSIENNYYNTLNIDFNSQIGFRMGLEAEFFLPFNKDKWAVLIEPAYQYFRGEEAIINQSVSVDYTSFEFPIGLRYYFYFNERSSVFIDGLFNLNFSGNSGIDFERTTDLLVDTSNNLAFGLGYNYHKKYSLELRYGLDRDIICSYLYWNSRFNSLSVILGYTLF